VLGGTTAEKERGGWVAHGKVQGGNDDFTCVFQVFILFFQLEGVASRRVWSLLRNRSSRVLQAFQNEVPARFCEVVSVRTFQCRLSRKMCVGRTGCVTFADHLTCAREGCRSS